MRRSLHGGACPSTFLVLSLLATSLVFLAGCKESGGPGSGAGTPTLPGVGSGAVSGYVFRVADGSAQGRLVICPNPTAPAGGEPAAGVTVTLANEAGVARTTTTGPDGFFSMGVEARAYTLTATLGGFSSVSVALAVQPNQTIRADSTVAMVAGLHVVSASAPDGTHVDVLFSEVLAGGSVSASAFTIQPSLEVTAAALQADGKTVRLTTAKEQVRFYPYTVAAQGVRDTRGVLLDPNGAAAAFSGNGVAPQVVGVSAVDTTHVDVRFSETLAPTEAAAVGSYTTQPALVISAAALQPKQPDGTVTVRLTTAEQLQGVTYTLAVHEVKDEAGNVVDAEKIGGTFVGMGQLPELVSAKPIDSTQVEVLFSEAVSADTANTVSNYRIDPTVTILSATLAADGVTVRLTTREHGLGTWYALTVGGVQDLAGNKIAAGSSTYGYTGIGGLPSVVSATGVNGTTVDVLFSEAVDSGTANKVANYAANLGLGVQSAVLQADGKTVRLTTSLQTQGTSYSLTISDVKDLAGNRLSTGANTAQFVGAPVLPQVASALGIDSTHVELVFSKAVTVATANLAAAYTVQPELKVTAAALQGDGKTVRLTTGEQVRYLPYTVTASGVKDVAGNGIDPLRASAGFIGNGAPPQVVAVTAVDSTHVDVFFDEPIAAAEATQAASFVALPQLSVDAAELLAGGTTVRLTTGEQKEGTVYSLTITNVKDLVGNATGLLPEVAVWNGLGLAPRVLSATAAEATQVDLLFSEPVLEAEANRAANYAMTPSLAVTAATLQDDRRTVRLTTAAQAKGTVYVATARAVTDLVGNAIDPAQNGAPFTGVEGQAAPRVLGAQAFDGAYVHVLFSERVDPVTAAAYGNYSFTPALSPRAASILSDGTTVRVKTTSQTSGTSYTLAVRNVKDLGGNALDTAAAGATFTGSADTPPTLVSATPVDTTHVDLAFSEMLSASSAALATRYSFTPSLTAARGALLPDLKTVRLVTGQQAAGTSYTVSVQGVEDLAGNAVVAPAAPVTFTGIGPSTFEALSGASVTPGTGNNSAGYLYRVTYTDPDNIAPVYVRLSVFGATGERIGMFPMAKADPADVTYTDGCVYQWRSSMLPGPLGTLTYHIDASDGSRTAQTLSGSGPAVSSALDGRIAFASNRTGAYEIFVMKADGTAPTQVSKLGVHAFGPRWSPDGGKVVFAAADGLYTADVNKTLADGTIAHSKLGATTKQDTAPDWSPAGGRIAFVSVRDGNAEIYLVDPDGNNLARLTNNHFEDLAPAWSADGSKIAFVSRRDGNEEIYVMNPDGSGETRLTRNTYNDWEPRWAPDGLRLVFTSNRDGNEEIYVMNADGSGQARMTQNTLTDWHPMWMADGKHILFASYRDGDGEICVMNDDGSGQVALTNNAIQDMSPSFSASRDVRAPYSLSVTASPTVLPASATAASTIKVTVRDGGFQPYSDAFVDLSTDLGTIDPVRAKPDSSGQVLATLTAGTTPGTATVSASVTGGLNPSSSVKVSIGFFGRIGFLTDRHGGGTTEVYAVGADGTGSARITSDADLQQHPSWSPDGSRFAVASGAAGSEEIYALDADAGHPTRLTDSPASDVDAAWSPDGSRVAFASNRDGNYEIYVMYADGTLPQRVTNDAAEDRRPSWSPDSLNLVFETTQAGRSDLVVVRPDGTGRRELVQDGAWPAWAPDNSRIAFQSSRDGNPEIYTIAVDGAGVPARLTNQAAADVQPTWAIQIPFLVFTSYRDGNGEIYVMNADGTGQTRVTDNPAEDSSPTCTWVTGPQEASPHSVTVTATATMLRANGADSCTVTATVRDGGYRVLPGARVTFSSPMGAFQPATAGTDDQGKVSSKFFAGTEPGLAILSATAEGGRSPVGTAALTLDAGSILFETNRDGNWEIYSMRGDGSDQTRITTDPAEDRSPVPSPDNTRIAFSTNRSADGKFHIWLMERDGTGLVQLTGTAASPSDGDDTEPAWTSDATRIYFISTRGGQRDLYVMYADGSGVSRMTNDVLLESGPVTRGTWTGYSTGDGVDDEMYLRDADLNAFIRSGNSGSRDYDITLSSDFQIAYTTNRDGNEEIYRLDPRNGTLYQQIRLTREDAWDGQAAWWPVGPRIAFASARDGNREIYVMNADGTKQTRLTTNAADEQAPAWLMDAETPRPYSLILTSSTAAIPANEAATCIFTAAVRDGAFRPIKGMQVRFTAKNGTVTPSSGVTDASGKCYATYRAGTVVGVSAIANEFSATSGAVTGKCQMDLHPGRVVFSSDTTGDAEIYTAYPDGLERERLTESLGDDRWPCWSPDNSQIAFQSNRGGAYDIYVMSWDGTSPTAITAGAGDNMEPAWDPVVTPARNRIAFVSTRDGNREVYLMNADGTGAKRLTNSPSDDAFPAWSPDGERIAFASDRSGNYEIYTMRPDGTEVTQLTYSAGEDNHPSWSPDGRRILFHSTRDTWAGSVAPLYQAYTMYPDGTSQTRVSTGATWSERYPDWSPDGRQYAAVMETFSDPDLYTRDLATIIYKSMAASRAEETGPAWSWGPYVSQVAPQPVSGQSRRLQAEVRLRAFSAGEEAFAQLTSAGLEVAEGASRAEGLRFVPIGASAAPGRGRTRTWDFAVVTPDAGADVSLSWPDLSGLGSRDRVTIEDLDARTCRSMRTTVAYTFRAGSDGTRHFRITATPRTGPAVAITGIEVVQTRSGARSVRFTLSTEADVDVDVMAPTGRSVGMVTRSRASQPGANVVSWNAPVSPGLYLLRITARTEDGTAVQAMRPIAIVR